MNFPRLFSTSHSTIALPGHALASALTFSMHAMGDLRARRFAGAKLEATARQLTIVCTDGHRLASALCRSTHLASETFDTWIPPDAAASLKRLAQKAELVHIGFDGRHLAAESSARRDAWEVSECPMHDYRNAVPSESSRVPWARLATSSLRRVVSEAGTARTKHDPLRIRIEGDGRVAVGERVIPAECDGGHGNGCGEAAFSTRYVCDAFSRLVARGIEWVRIELHGPCKPMVLVPAGDDPGHGTCLVVVMPRLTPGSPGPAKRSRQRHHA